jgi:hypothetical protein
VEKALRRALVLDAPHQRIDTGGRWSEERAERPARGVVRLSEGNLGLGQLHQGAAAWLGRTDAFVGEQLAIELAGKESDGRFEIGGDARDVVEAQ